MLDFGTRVCYNRVVFLQKATFIALIALLAMGAEIFLGDMNPDVITAEACVAGACFVLVIGGVLYKVLKK